MDAVARSRDFSSARGPPASRFVASPLRCRRAMSHLNSSDAPQRQRRVELERAMTPFLAPCDQERAGAHREQAEETRLGPERAAGPQRGPKLLDRENRGR